MVQLVSTGEALMERCIAEIPPGGERAPRCGPHGSLREGEAAPRGRDSGRERVVNVLSFNGRPGTRQGVRTPHRGAVLPR